MKLLKNWISRRSITSEILEKELNVKAKTTLIKFFSLLFENREIDRKKPLRDKGLIPLRNPLLQHLLLLLHLDEEVLKKSATTQPGIFTLKPVKSSECKGRFFILRLISI